MKYAKRYVVFTVLLGLVFLLKFQIFGVEKAQVGQFRGGSLDQEVWNPLVAEDVNAKQIQVVIDNRKYKSSQIPFFMNSDRNIMVPVSMLRDALGCSAFVYDDKKLLVEKHSTTVSMELGKNQAGKNGKKEKICSPLAMREGRLYVSLNDLSALLNYNCSFDMGKNTITASDEDTSAVLPASYDLRKRERVSKIYNQGAYGTCWAFAATSALESSLRPEEKKYFSVDHMTMSNSFHANQYDGGEYTMGMAYLAAWQGPVKEEDDPYGDGKTNGALSAVKHVQQMQIIDGKDYEGIKEAVFQYGGVQTSLYSTIRSSQGSNAYYNADTASYCYIGTEKPNHDVVIIGWDDNYPSSNFNAPLEGDGAFICQNSWGEDFGEKGIFYVSYYDTNIGTHNVVYTRVDDANNYDNIYQSDLCGWVGKLGYENEQIYGANVFKANGAEELTAASFYATGSNTEYEIYVVRNFANEVSFDEREKAASGIVKRAGYYTVDFTDTFELSPGEKYAVMVKLKTPGSKHPMAIEYDTGEKILEGVNLDDGEGYISLKGKQFINVKDKKECNLCIKAFTRNKKWTKEY